MKAQAQGGDEPELARTDDTQDRARGRPRWAKMALGAAIGAGLGYAYWVFIGCNTGTCPITSSPATSTAYGALIGGLAMGV